MSDDDKRQRAPSQQYPAQGRTVTPQTSQHPIGTPRGLSSNAGILASAAWLAARGLFIAPDKPWSVSVAIGTADRPASHTSFDLVDSRFTIHIRNEEWGYGFSQGSRATEIVIHDIPSVRGRDDHNLLAATPPLKNLGLLLREIETRYSIHFQRRHAAIQTTIAGAEPMVRAWVVSL